MTRYEATVISAFTGTLIGEFSDMHTYIEQIMCGPVWTHQLGDKEYVDKVKAAAKPDFIEIHESLTEG